MDQDGTRRRREEENIQFFLNKQTLIALNAAGHTCVQFIFDVHILYHFVDITLHQISKSTSTLHRN